MKYHIFIAILFFHISLFAQTEKGVTPVNKNQRPETGSTYAVVVGISDYQDEDIPDLRFADKDAEAFAAFLRSPAGGAVPSEQILLLQNEKATNARIADALVWMMEECSAGDQAIIYFSGHGDVETITRFNRGYLLTYDSPPKIYMAGALNIRDLQDIISTMSENDVQVVMISDACRAGKLAGTDVGGTAATAQNLSQQFANEVKILSCQPNEFSIEGPQWGGGRGAFSYHLLDGLHGLADKNGDDRVNLFEIGRYLEDWVPEETAPHNQMPFTVGDRNTQLAVVDATSLVQLRAKKAGEQKQFSEIETKGMEQLILATADTSIHEMYAAFTNALDTKRLLEPAGECAYDLYQVLSQRTELKDLHNIMRRNLSVALQEDGQQAVNAYLGSNPEELRRRYESDEDYNLYPRYLEKAAELLGESHFYYKNLMAQQHYFEGLGLRLAAVNETETARDSIYEVALQIQLKALEYQEHAPYVLNELGALHILLKQDSIALGFLDRAIEASPGWGLPYVNYSVGSYYLNDINKAIEYGEKAAERLPNFPRVYSFLAWINANSYKYSEIKNLFRSGIELRDDYRYQYDDIHSLGQRHQLLARSIELLKKAIAMDSSYAFAYHNLATVYSIINQPQKALEFQLKATELAPRNRDIVISLGTRYLFLNKEKEAEEAYLKAIALDSTYFGTYINLSVLYKKMGNLEKGIEVGKKAIALNSSIYIAYFNVADAYFKTSRFKEAEEYVIKALDIDKGNPKLFLGLYDIFKRLNRYEEAEWMSKRALKIKPDYLKAISRLIDLYIITGQYKKAKEWQERVLDIAPDDAAALFSTGKTAYLTKEYEQAENYFQKVVNTSHSRASDYLAIGKFYAHHGENDLAENYLRKALQKDNAWLNRGTLANFLFWSDRIKEAHDLLDIGLVDTTYSEIGILNISLSKGSYYFYSGKTEKGLPFMRQWDEGISTNYVQIVKKLNARDFQEIQKEMEKMDSTWAYGFFYSYLQSRIYAELNQPEIAMAGFRKMLNHNYPYQFIQNDPGLASLRKLPGYEQLMRRSFPEKYEDLDTFEFEDPEPIYYPENCLLLAEFYESEGEHERAKFLREKAEENSRP